MSLTPGLKLRVKRLEEALVPPRLGLGALVAAAHKRASEPVDLAAKAAAEAEYLASPKPTSLMSARLWNARQRLQIFELVDLGEIPQSELLQRLHALYAVKPGQCFKPINPEGVHP